MGLIDNIGRLLFGATAQERVEMQVTLVERRLAARLVAALDDVDESRRCAACHGEGYVVVDDGPAEAPCAACDGSGLREEKASGGDGEWGSR